MPYITPIETSTTARDSINVSSCQLLIDRTEHSLYYDTTGLERISLSDIILLNTEDERLSLSNILENKLYIVTENVRPYIFRAGQWMSITVAKNDPFNLFFINSTDGDDANTGVSNTEPVASLSTIFNKYNDVVIYNILAVAGDYIIDDLTISSKTKIIINGNNANFIGAITIHNVGYIEFNNCSFTDITITAGTTAVFNNCTFYTNGITCSMGSVAKINSCNITASVGDTNGMINSIEGSNIICNTCSGTISTKPVYYANTGGIINVSKDNTMTSMYKDLYITEGTGKIFLEADSTDTKTKEYINTQITEALNSAKSYTDTKIATALGIEEVY